MGLHGRGAALRKEMIHKIEREGATKFPWEKPNLDRAEKVIAFCEFMPVTKGILAGKKTKLLPDQKEFIRAIYAPGPDGLRAITLAIKSEPKGNGKTGLISCIALAHMVGPESEERGEVYSAAIDRGQASLLFAEMVAIVERIPEFASSINIVRNQKKMEVLRNVGQAKCKGTTYEALSADARRAHGIAPSLWVYDELAQAKTRELLDNLLQGMSKRKEALGIVISTQAPEDSHPLSLLIDDALTGADPTTYLQLHCAYDDDDPWDIEVWKRINPAWGIFLNSDDFKKAADRAKRNPAFEPSFRNLRLNMRVNPIEEARLSTAYDWKKGAEPPLDIKSLEGRMCFGGLDLSGKVDLTALVLVFPNEGSPPSYDVLPFFWTPADQLTKRSHAELERMTQWIREGYIETIPGPIIRYDFVANRLAELAKRFKIREIAYDKWRIEDLQAALTDLRVEGLPLKEFGQGHVRVMAPAIESFTECNVENRLHHGGNPVLAASVLNAIVLSDTSGNPKLDKSNSSRSGPVRVDGAVALVMALGTAFRAKPEREFKLMMVG
jgi:phage terminase large subunit-like protein